MKIQLLQKDVKIPAVKIGVSRQIVVPKKLYDQLEITPGDYFDVELKNNKLIFTPKTLVERDLARGLKDINEGRIIGPFKTAKEAIKALQEIKS